jgi:hypothetical protein
MLLAQPVSTIAMALRIHPGEHICVPRFAIDAPSSNVARFRANLGKIATQPWDLSIACWIDPTIAACSAIQLSRPASSPTVPNQSAERVGN